MSLQPKRINMKSNINLSFLLITILLFSCGETKKGKEKVKTSTDKIQINNNGVLINYETCGEGNITLLFVHGWAINQTYWAKQVEALCPDYKVVTIDLPGFGKSGKNRENWTIEEFAGDVNSVINQLQLKNVVLIGHSMGGDIILESALKNKEVIALIGIDNFKMVGMEFTDEVMAEFDGFVKMMSENFSKTILNYTERALFHSSSDSISINRVKHDFSVADSTIAVACLESLFDYAPKEFKQLSKLKQKLYLINSDMIPTDTEGLKSTGISFEVIEMHATGHYPMIEKPEEFNTLLKQTISKIAEEQNISSN